MHKRVSIWRFEQVQTPLLDYVWNFSVSVVSWFSAALPEVYIPRCPNDEMGQDFVVAFMENKFYDPNYNLEIYPSTELRGVNIEVDAYLNQSAGIQQLDSFQLGPRQMHIVEVPSSLQLSGTEQALKSVRISSSQKIGIYAMNSINDSCDGFLVLPVQFSGDRLLHDKFLSAGPADRLCHRGRIRQHPSQRNVPNGDETRDNDRLEGDEIQEWRYDSNDLWTETRRHRLWVIPTSLERTSFSNKPIAVFSGNDYTTVFSGPIPPDYAVAANHLVEQLPPTDRWGKLFYLLPIPNSTFDYLVKIVNSVANTTVTITDVNGNINEFTLSNPGDFPGSSIHYNIPVTIRSTAPILVAQFAGSGYSNYPTMIVIPPAERFNSIYTVPTAHSDFTTFLHYLLLIVDHVDLPGLTIDGLQAPQTGWTKFSNDTNIVGRALKIDNGVHTIRQSGGRSGGGVRLWVFHWKQ